MEEATVKKNKYEMDMCSGALLPKILLYSLPETLYIFIFHFTTDIMV